jgi:hypothetical protein
MTYRTLMGVKDKERGGEDDKGSKLFICQSTALTSNGQITSEKRDVAE